MLNNSLCLRTAFKSKRRLSILVIMMSFVQVHIAYRLLDNRIL